jgi:hypothetical protein
MKYTLDHVRSLQVGMHRNQEILLCMNDLCPELRLILDRELSAGNKVMDASRDWPDRDSVFITLSQPFSDRYEVQGPVRYNEPNDPHYWQADYSCGDPLHIIAH